MAVDYGLYQGLQYNNDFATQAQNAKDNLAYVGGLAKQAEDQRLAEQKAQEGVQGYLDAYQKAYADALPVDKQRIQDYYDKILTPLKESIGQNPQSISQWQQNGGYQDLDKFQNALLNGNDERGSNPIRDNQASRVQYAKAIADQQAGLPYRSLNGQPYSLQDALQRVQSGQDNVLQYPGAYKRQKYDLNDFINHYGPKGKEVIQGFTPSALQGNMTKYGLDPEQIRQDLPKFFDKSKISENNPYGSIENYKYDEIDPNKIALQKAQLANYYSEIKARNSEINARNAKTAGSGDGQDYLSLLGGLYSGSGVYTNETDQNINAQGQPIQEGESPFQYQKSPVFNGVELGKFLDSDTQKPETNTVEDFKRLPDGNMWFKTTQSITNNPNDENKQWIKVTDLHTQLGSPYLKHKYGAGGALKTNDHARAISKKLGDLWKNGHPDYSRYSSGLPSKTEPQAPQNQITPEEESQAEQPQQFGTAEDVHPVQGIVGSYNPFPLKK